MTLIPSFAAASRTAALPMTPDRSCATKPSNFFFPTASFLPILLGDLGPHVHVVALHSPRMRDNPSICAAQQGIRPELDELSQINASANQLKVQDPLYLLRGVYRSTAELETVIPAYLDAVSANPKPFR